jgi:adenylate kinase family enzyme
MFNASHIAIIGNPGAGKTTLGLELARLLDATFVEVDALAHQAGWVEASDDELRAALDHALGTSPRWVIDGTFQRRLGTFVSGRVDLFVWLDLPLRTKLSRVWRRSWHRVTTKEVLWNGNVERWRDVFLGADSVLLGLIRRHVRDRRASPVAGVEQQLVVRLRSPKQVEAWLASVPRSVRR